MPHRIFDFAKRRQEGFKKLEIKPPARILHAEMNRVLQMCLMMLVLLMQSAPLIIVASPQEEKCQMACCAWLEQAGMSDCTCAEPSLPSQNLPASLPPASEGRSFIPQVVWTELSQDFRFPPFQAKPTGCTIRPAEAEHASARPHVRLSVLLCSMLT